MRSKRVLASPALAAALAFALCGLAPGLARADLGERVTAALARGSLLAFVLVFAGGVLTSLTPCVYPMIPITLGIIGAPCTGPVLASVLTYVATTRSAVFGGSLLFTYALGMGLLFFFLAATAASLPKSGAWMEAVKSVFGVVMLVAALYFLRNVVKPLHAYGDWRPRFASLHLGVAVAGLLVGGVHLSFHGGLAARVRKALGVGAIVFGAFGLIAWTLT